MEIEEQLKVPVALRQLLSVEQAWHYHILPLSKDNESFTLAIAEGKNSNQVQKELSVLYNCTVKLQSHPDELVHRELSKHYRKSLRNSRITNIDTSRADVFLKQLILEAKMLDASDIHLEIFDANCRVRMRIDGHLIEKYKLEKEYYPALVNKVKISAHLNISEKRLPQDGRIIFKEHGENFDIRVSVLPTLHGEKVVMRLLGKDASHVNLSELGMSALQYKHYLAGVYGPNGIILISGPTGSGKTTTLYATLKMLNQEQRNIVTIEDPIEYTLEGINQVQLKEDIGLSFSSALRSFLRQDPDVIMLGEIRDAETAEMAIRAALTGHLVLSTIHTNSAMGTVSRLLDMGIPAYLIASTLNTTVAQRLVRRLCTFCKKDEKDIPNDLWPPHLPRPQQIKAPDGCEHCHYTGYKGRLAVYEIIPVTSFVAEKIKDGSTQIDNFLKENKIHNLAQGALHYLETGDTSLEEVYPLLLSQ